MLETGIVTVAILTVWLVLRAADKWGDRETYTAQTWAAAQTRQATDEQNHAETWRHTEETV